MYKITERQTYNNDWTLILPTLENIRVDYYWILTRLQYDAYNHKESNKTQQDQRETCKIRENNFLILTYERIVTFHCTRERHDLVNLLGEDALVQYCLKGLDDLVGHGMVARQPGHHASNILRKKKIKQCKTRVGGDNLFSYFCENCQRKDEDFVVTKIHLWRISHKFLQKFRQNYNFRKKNANVFKFSKFSELF